MRKLLGVALISLICGCSTVQTVATSRTTFATCRAADTVTTLAILHQGGHELNPLLKGLVAHPALFVLFNIVAVVVEWNVHKDLNPTERAALNVVSCVGPINNTAVLLGH